MKTSLAIFIFLSFLQSYPSAVIYNNVNDLTSNCSTAQNYITHAYTAPLA